MKRVGYLFLLFLAFGCGDEPVDDSNDLENLKEGEFIIQVYNRDGALVFAEKGDTESWGVKGYWTIQLLGSSVASEGSDPLQFFSSFSISGQSPVVAPTELQLNKAVTAEFSQRLHAQEGDWLYMSTGGTTKITLVDQSKVHGSFEITMDVPTESHPHPNWGDHILVKGRFLSACTHENSGGCLSGD